MISKSSGNKPGLRSILIFEKLFSLFICLIISLPVFSLDTIILSDQFDEHLITKEEFEILEDPNGKLSFKDIRSNPDKFKKPYEDLDLKVNNYVWVRFRILSKTSTDKNWVLQLPFHSEKISLYISSSDGSFKEYVTGQDYLFNSRTIDLRTIAYELPTPDFRPIEVYIRIFSEKYNDFAFILSKEKRYLEVHTKGYLFLGLIYGILLLMVVYNLILYISIREQIYIYYVLYTLSAIFFISWKDGLGFQFIWPSFPEINDYHYNLGLFLLLGTFMFFANDFLELNQKKPLLKKITYGIILVNFIYFLVNIFSNAFFEPLPLLYIASYLYFLVISVYFFLRNYKPARYLLISLLCMIGALVVIKLRYMGILGWNWFIEYILNYAVATEAIVMSLAISDKLSYLREQKEKVQEAKLREEKLKAENELIQLTNKHLKEDVRNSNNELSILATNLAQKSEFLNQFKKEIQLISREVPSNESLQKLIKTIERNSEFQSDWDYFQINFDKQHSNFLNQLRSKFPNLKPTDLLLCAYIKLNKSNKEIATLLNISVSGVEKKRTRLKEKLQLNSEDSLTDFILQLK